MEKYGCFLQPLGWMKAEFACKVQSDSSRFVWLPNANSNDIDNRLHCSICTPLDDGEALKDLYTAVEAFMPDNSVACLATMASCVMGAAYQQIISTSGHVGVPFMFGNPGSCKTEAILCGLSLFGAQDTHLMNSQTTPSYLFGTLKRTTIPIAVDDISEKTQDTWEELIIDAYNNTARGTRSYSVESFSTLPILSANWRFPSGKGRAFTRCISIPFVEHKDEPNAPQLYSNLKRARRNASASEGELIQWCTEFSTDDAQMSLQGDLFRTTSAIYERPRTFQDDDDNLYALFPQGRLHAILLSVYTDHGIVVIATMETFYSLQISVMSLTTHVGILYPLRWRHWLRQALPTPLPTFQILEMLSTLSSLCWPRMLLTFPRMRSVHDFIYSYIEGYEIASYIYCCAED